MPIINNWKLVVMERYVKFDGRAGRAEYWWFTLANIIAAAILFGLGSASNIFFILYVIYAFALILPSIAVGIRRLHDTNKTGWLMLVPLIPLVGWIILLVFMIQAGDEEANQYGAGPEPAG